MYKEEKGKLKNSTEVSWKDLFDYKHMNFDSKSQLHEFDDNTLLLIIIGIFNENSENFLDNKTFKRLIAKKVEV